MCYHNKLSTIEHDGDLNLVMCPDCFLLQGHLGLIGWLKALQSMTPICYFVPTLSWQCGGETPGTFNDMENMEIGGPPISGTPPHTPTLEGVPMASLCLPCCPVIIQDTAS